MSAAIPFDEIRRWTFDVALPFWGDAGFVGYDVWNSILEKWHRFLSRIGSNVRLITKLEYYARRNGNLMTNVLNARLLSGALALRLYKLCWGIKSHFHTLKQTFGRCTLRSKIPSHTYVELEWSLVGLWMIHLFAVKDQVRIGEPPVRTSAALVIPQVVRAILFLWCDEVPESGADLTT